MKWTIEYVKVGNYFKVVNEGVYETGDCVNLFENLFENKLWYPGASILFDNRLVDYKGVSYNVMSRSSFSVAHFEDQIGRSRLGYIAKSSIGYGVCRQFQMLMEVKISTVIEVFTEEEEAIKWLTERQLEQSKSGQ